MKRPLSFHLAALVCVGALAGALVFLGVLSTGCNAILGNSNGVYVPADGAAGVFGDAGPDARNPCVLGTSALGTCTLTY